MSRYEFSLQQEVLMEKGAAVLADLLWYEREHNLEEGNPFAVLYELVWRAKRRILSSKVETDLVQIDAQFEFAKQFLNEIKVGAHA